ncbi:hypothetical protein [Chamaesiphon sp. VAR_69_metabat_338]|nr:hypothetical protein [Chamaesiphon sp. VAR_69_metabat_338]
MSIEFLSVRSNNNVIAIDEIGIISELFPGMNTNDIGAASPKS